MSEGKPSLAERREQFEAARKLRLEQATAMWLSVKDDKPLDEHFYRRTFAIEILNNDADLHPRVAEFLGRSAVDRNAFSQKQKDWLARLIEEYLGIAAPAIEPKAKAKKGAEK